LKCIKTGPRSGSSFIQRIGIYNQQNKDAVRYKYLTANRPGAFSLADIPPAYRPVNRYPNY